VDGIFLAEHLIKIIKERRQRIMEMMSSGAVKNIEEYRQLVGSLESMDYIDTELKQLLHDHTE
jgi:hypothetical protein|tara:strand:+ start:172 stop:360 length:189 start_codon:yes stop_codon:yes gene_type:complete